MSSKLSRLCRKLKYSLLPSKMKVSDKDISVMNQMELAIAPERTEILAMQTAREDPYSINITKRGPSSKYNPNIIYSYYASRIVGCVCEEDTSIVNWFWLHSGGPKRCSCGHWFKLEKYNPA